MLVVQKNNLYKHHLCKIRPSFPSVLNIKFQKIISSSAFYRQKQKSRNTCCPARDKSSFRLSSDKNYYFIFLKSFGLSSTARVQISVTLLSQKPKDFFKNSLYPSEISFCFNSSPSPKTATVK